MTEWKSEYRRAFFDGMDGVNLPQDETLKEGWEAGKECAENCDYFLNHEPDMYSQLELEQELKEARELVKAI